MNFCFRQAARILVKLSRPFMPRGTGALLMPISKKESLKGLAKGAKPNGWRDRSDRT